MSVVKLLAITAVSAVSLAAADRPDFSGTWRMETAEPGSAAVILIVQNDTDLRLSTPDAQKDSTDVKCNTMGKACEAKVDGERVQVSYWYNGPMLVQMVIEGKNDRVTETRRKLSEDGQKMLVEVIPIVPTGKSPEKIVFIRDQKMAGTPTTSAPEQQQ